MKAKILIILLVVFIAQSLSAQSGSSLGLAGAYTTFARGSEAIFWNPANLGFRDEGKPGFTMTLFSLNLAVSNNAYNMDDYETYFTVEDKFLTTADKDDIKSKIPDDGWEFDFRNDIELFAMAYKNYALSFSVYGSAELKAPKDFVDIAFTGLRDNKLYDFSTTVDVELVSSMNFAYGQTVWRDIPLVVPYLEKPMKITEIALGGVFSYNMGAFAFTSERADFTAFYDKDGLVGRGHFIGKGSRMKRILNDEGEYDTEIDDEEVIVGKGIGLSFAASAKTESNYIISLVLKNIYNKTTWDQSVLQIDRELDTGDKKFFVGAGQLEDLDEDEITHDNDREISDFQTTRPFGFRFAVGRETGPFMYASEIGFEDEEFVFALGGGYKWSIINLFGGYGFKFGHSFNFGFGLGGDHFMWDIGFGTQNGITPGGTQGVLAATSLRFGF